MSYALCFASGLALASFLAEKQNDGDFKPLFLLLLAVAFISVATILHVKGF